MDIIFFVFCGNKQKFSIKVIISIYNPEPICFTSISIVAICFSSKLIVLYKKHVIGFVFNRTCRMYFYICVFPILRYKPYSAHCHWIFFCKLIRHTETMYHIFFKRTWHPIKCFWICFVF